MVRQNKLVLGEHISKYIIFNNGYPLVSILFVLIKARLISANIKKSHGQIIIHVVAS